MPVALAAINSSANSCCDNTLRVSMRLNADAVPYNSISCVRMDLISMLHLTLSNHASLTQWLALNLSIINTMMRMLLVELRGIWISLNVIRDRFTLTQGLRTHLNGKVNTIRSGLGDHRHSPLNLTVKAAHITTMSSKASLLCPIQRAPNVMATPATKILFLKITGSTLLWCNQAE